MGKRHGLDRRSSQGMFRRTADYIHPKNGLRGNAGPMRGGIRL